MSAALRRAPAWCLAFGLAVAPAAARAEPEVDCLIEPWEQVTLAAATEGVIEEVLVDRGDQVEKGQVVARLESSVERASRDADRVRAEATGLVQSSQARLEFAQQKLERQQKLDERNIVSRSDLDEAVSSMRVAAAELQAAREAQAEAKLDLRRTEAMLERRSIRSPVDGVVVERIISPGEYADPPQVMKLAQIDPLRVEAFVPLELFGRIEKGMTAEVVPEGPLKRAVSAQVTVVDPVIDAASATFRVRLKLPNPDHALPAGLSCTVRFPLTDTAKGPEPRLPGPRGPGASGAVGGSARP